MLKEILIRGVRSPRIRWVGVSFLWSLLQTSPCRAVEASPFIPSTTRSVAANRIAGRPDYSRLWSQAARDYGLPGAEGVDWLDAGIDVRLRYEVRENNYRTASLVSDDAVFTRTLVYLGINDVIDPVRVAVEFQDSERFLSDRAVNLADINQPELIQAHVDLHFDDVIGGQPFTAGFGRMSFDVADRRLIARNRYRNTINSFDGLRLRFGSEKSPWEVDAFALRPVLREPYSIDQSSNNSLLFGMTGYWRRGSPGFQLEPFWLLTDRTVGPGVNVSQEQHTFGFHAFGQWGGSHWDYDLSVAGQLGLRGANPVQAWAVHGEIGYTWEEAWKPHLGVWMNAASGDSGPGDPVERGFDPLYGSTFSFYGYTSYFSWNNIISPSFRFSVQPSGRIRSELIHRVVWLESDTAPWQRGARVDRTGQAGGFVGQELDARISYAFYRWLDAEVAYALFLPGSFVANTGRSPLSSFNYVQLTLRF